MRCSVLVTLVLLIGPALAGCTSYAPPKLEVVEAALAAETPDGLVISFALDAANDNAVELPLRQVRYRLALDGRRVFEGVRSPEATLRRYGSQRIVFPAVVALGPEGDTGAGRTRPTGEVAYRLEGELMYTTPGQIARILFDAGVSRPSVAFAREGRIDLGAPPAPAPSGP